MGSENVTYRKWITNLWLPFLKTGLALASIYMFYFIYSISGFSFIQGVDNSSKTEGSITLAVLHGDVETQDYIAGLSDELNGVCNAPLVVREYDVIKKDPSDKIEEIVVVGSRGSAVSGELLEIDVIAALKKVGAKIIENETSKFLATYSTKISIDGFYHLTPIPKTDNKKWQISIKERCIRVLRFFELEGELTIAADLVFKFEYSHAIDAIRLDLIFFNINYTAAKSLSHAINMDIKLSSNWITDADYGEATAKLKSETLLSLGKLPLGQDMSTALGGSKDKSLNHFLISKHILNASSWTPAPPFDIHSVRACIRERKECHFIAGDIAFTFIETGDGADLVSDMSKMIIE
jgi:hypothetical protein